MATSDLAVQTGRLVLGDMLHRLMMYFSVEDLAAADPEHGPLAYAIRLLEAVASGEDTATDADEVRGYVQTICEALFSRVGEAAYDVPEDWWSSPLGRVCSSALAVTEGEDLISIADAARELDVPLATLWARVRRGSYHYVVIQDRRRGRPRRMLYRSEIEAGM